MNAALLMVLMTPLDPEPPREVTPADLHACAVLDWAGQRWPFRLDARGNYFCGDSRPAEAGESRQFWAGTWTLREGGVVLLSEAQYRAEPDGPPGSGYRLAGFGWGQACSLGR